MANALPGPIAIHAGKGTQYMTKKEMAEEGFPSGEVIATATLAACMPLQSMRCISRSQVVERAGMTIGDILDHEHTEGPWRWILTDVVPVDPVKCNGSQGLWDFDDTQLVESERSTERDAKAE